MIAKGGKMNKRFGCIVEYLEKIKKESFTGSVKLSFERGEIVAINEANQHDLPTKENNYKDITTHFLEMASNPIFNGTVVFEFQYGKIIKYAYSKTYKGETLKKFLGV